MLLFICSLHQSDDRGNLRKPVILRSVILSTFDFILCQQRVIFCKCSIQNSKKIIPGNHAIFGFTVTGKNAAYISQTDVPVSARPLPWSLF